MWSAFGDMRQNVGLQGFWASAIRLAVGISLGLALLFVAFTAFVFVLPLVLAGGLALHFYLRRKLRQAREEARRHAPHAATATVIEGEYTVIEREERRG
jgi:hypothetical protein